LRFEDYLTWGLCYARARSVPPADLASADFNLHPIGTGPFKVQQVEASSGQIDHVLLTANTGYYRTQPYLDKIEIKFFADDAAVFNAYRAGQVQGIARVAYSDLPRLRQFPHLNVFSAPVAGYSLIFLNLSSPDVPFFQDKNVRQALFYALDRKSRWIGIGETALRPRADFARHVGV
jgi:peptide/nickel transport system substrate-binding protein